MMINKEWQNSKGNKWRNNYYKIKEGAEDSLFVTKLGYLGAMKKKKKKNLWISPNADMKGREESNCSLWNPAYMMLF